MRRVLVLRVLAIVVLLGLVGRGAPNTTAQEGTPDAGRTSAGVTYEHITIVSAGTLPAGPIDLGVAQFTVAPGGSLPLPGTNPPTLYYVAAGAVTARVESEVTVDRAGEPDQRVAAETEIALVEGDAIVVPANGVGELRNDGQTSAVLLIAFVGPAREGTPSP